MVHLLHQKYLRDYWTDLNNILNNYNLLLDGAHWEKNYFTTNDSYLKLSKYVIFDWSFRLLLLIKNKTLMEKSCRQVLDYSLKNNRATFYSNRSADL